MIKGRVTARPALSGKVVGHVIADGGYDRGYAEGEAVGYEKGSTDGYETGYKDGGNGLLSSATGLGWLFHNAVFPEGTDVEVYCPNFRRFADHIGNGTSGLRKLTLICDDTSGDVSFSQSFSGSSIEILDITNFKRKLDGVVNLLLNSKMVTILGALDCSNFTSTPTNFFTNAYHLEDVTFVPETIGFSLSIKTATLSTDSAKSAILGLKNFSGTDKAYTCTLSLHPKVWTLLDAEGNAAPHGGTWKEYVQAVLCWNI